MTEENKILLAKDLFGRALSGVKVNYKGNVYTLGYNMYLKDGDVAFESYPMMYFLEGVEEVKPYLRPMSSMTEEEKREYGKFCELDTEILENHPMNGEPFPALYNSQDWLNRNMFDYRGLIPMGLAIEAPEDMYNKH